MAENLSPARATLLATQLAASADLTTLQVLISFHQTIFTNTQIFQLLLVSLPETTAPFSYTTFLRQCVDGSIYNKTDVSDTIDISSIADVSEKTARKSLRQANLYPIQEASNDSTQLLSQWLLQRARNIDVETGIVSLIDELLEPFIESSAEIYGWYTGIVQVLTKFIYEHHELDGTYGLSQFEALDASSGISALLSRSTPTSVVKDLDELIIPYIRYRGRTAKEDPWRWVWEWIVGRAAGDLDIVAAIANNWASWEFEELGTDYARALMASCYVSRDLSLHTLKGVESILGAVAQISKLGRSKISPQDVQQLLSSVDTTQALLPPALLSPNMPLTTPTPEAIALLDMLLRSGEILSPYTNSMTIAGLAKLRISGSKDRQIDLLSKILTSDNWLRRDDNEWKRIRIGLQWLQKDGGLLASLDKTGIDTKILKTLLQAAKFSLVSEIYVGQRKPPPLSNEIVEESVLEAVLDFYDKASNGNKTRGSMKTALNALQILYPNHSQAPSLARAAKLIDSTHALSSYSLTLTPGVPLKPVQIRNYPDPPNLISRVLQSNPKSYTQLDVLLNIARDLSYGVSNSSDPPPTKADIQLSARVTGMCVEAALAEDDFETAYSLILNRLIPRSTETNLPMSSSLTRSSTSSTSPNDTAWRAAFQAGRYRPPHHLEATNTLSLRQLEMRMELLSHALIICPSDAMTEILNVWRRCEEELNTLLEREAIEEEQHASKLSWPGGFTTSTSTSSIKTGIDTVAQGPLSLFAVAAEATKVAKALGSSAFPLRKAGDVRVQADGRTSSEYGDDERGGIGGSLASWAGGSGSVGERGPRKRDMLSGMVTNSLASGLGWVIGASPSPAPQQRDSDDR